MGVRGEKRGKEERREENKRRNKVSFQNSILPIIFKPFFPPSSPFCACNQGSYRRIERREEWNSEEEERYESLIFFLFSFSFLIFLMYVSFHLHFRHMLLVQHGERRKDIGKVILISFLFSLSSTPFLPLLLYTPCSVFRES